MRTFKEILLEEKKKMTKSARIKFINRLVSLSNKQDKLEKELNWSISTGRNVNTIQSKLKTISDKEQEIYNTISKDEDLQDTYEDIMGVDWEE